MPPQSPCQFFQGQEGLADKRDRVIGFRAFQAGVAQRVEQLICNQPVGGSNPFASSMPVELKCLSRPRARREEDGRFTGRFPSGQREQTVNLPAMPSEVRILLSPPHRGWQSAQVAAERRAVMPEAIDVGRSFRSIEGGSSSGVEHQPSKLRVAGSNPVSRSRNVRPRGSVVEHFLGKEGVTGSIPVVGSTSHGAARGTIHGEMQAAPDRSTSRGPVTGDAGNRAGAGGTRWARRNSRERSRT